MKRVIWKYPIKFYGVDGWQVLVHDVDVFKRGEIPCENCMYDDEMNYDCDATCMDIHGCFQNPYTYIIFVEGYLSDETGKENKS